MLYLFHFHCKTEEFRYFRASGSSFKYPYNLHPFISCRTKLNINNIALYYAFFYKSRIINSSVENLRFSKSLRRFTAPSIADLAKNDLHESVIFLILLQGPQNWKFWGTKIKDFVCNDFFYRTPNNQNYLYSSFENK